MRILHVIQELRTGGAERVALALAAGARAAGYEVATAAHPGELEREFDGRLFRLPLVERRPWRLPSAALGVRRAIRDWRPDLVHAHNPGMAAAVGLATRRGRTVPALVSFHGVPEEDYGTAARVLRLAGLPIVACGPGVAAALADRGVRAATTIVNGVAAPPPPAERDAVLRELGLPAGRPFVVTAGRLVEQKNHQLAVEAFADVDGAVLAIFGEGPLRAELERAIDANGLRGRVVLPGVRADLREVVGAADVFLLSSRWEGLPLVVLEALAAGTPVVATDVRGIRELFADGTGGVLVPPADAAALAEAVERVLRDRELAAGLTRDGRELAAAYDEGTMVARYLELYEGLA